MTTLPVLARMLTTWSLAVAHTRWRLGLRDAGVDMSPLHSLFQSEQRRVLATLFADNLYVFTSSLQVIQAMSNDAADCWCAMGWQLGDMELLSENLTDTMTVKVKDVVHEIKAQTELKVLGVKQWAQCIQRSEVVHVELLRRGWKARWKAARWLDATKLRPEEKLILGTRLIDDCILYGAGVMKWRAQALVCMDKGWTKIHASLLKNIARARATGDIVEDSKNLFRMIKRARKL